MLGTSLVVSQCVGWISVRDKFFRTQPDTIGQYHVRACPVMSSSGPDTPDTPDTPDSSGQASKTSALLRVIAACARRSQTLVSCLPRLC